MKTIWNVKYQANKQKKHRLCVFGLILHREHGKSLVCRDKSLFCSICSVFYHTQWHQRRITITVKLIDLTTQITIDITICDVNSSDVVRVQTVLRNIGIVKYSTAPSTSLNGLKATKEKASNPSRMEPIH